MDHPPQWELSFACGADERGHVAFADRCFTRMDVTWQPLTYVPKLELLIEKYRQRKTNRKDEVALEPLADVGKDWRGVVRKADKGVFMHAVRFFGPQRLLVEATIVWPQTRRARVERDILESIQAWPVEEPQRHWRALGLDVRIDSRLDLLSSDPKPGRVSWTFGRRGRAVRELPEVQVERLAMVEHWIDGTIQQWMERSLPFKSAVLEKTSTSFNGHPAQRLLSERKIGTVSSLRGLRQRRLDIAWICPTDGRMYHLVSTQARRDRNVELPMAFAVDCCVPAPAVHAEEL